MTKSPAEREAPPADKQHRPLYVIASDIRADWPRPHFAAVPYLFALRHLNRATESYGADSALSIIAYFLSNARTWRGPRATAIKNELRDILKGHGYE